jgi:integrase
MGQRARGRLAGTVKLVACKGRAIELRYWCPVRRRVVRRSSRTTNRREAEREAHRIEDELAHGVYSIPGHLAWREFVERYDRDHLVLQRRKTRDKAHTVLTAVADILKPGLLADVADAQAIVAFRTALAAGRGSRFGRPRSPHTVKSYVVALLAALNWAASLRLVPPIGPIPKSGMPKKRKTMKGRPITAEEFERMLAKVRSVVGEAAAPSWTFLLRGLWESALRLDEAMSLSWDIPYTIRPVWHVAGFPSLLIPGEEQKNTEDDEIPLLPGFERLLLEVPEAERSGYVFRPASLQPNCHRRSSKTRPNAEWVGRVITRIGTSAGVVVEPAKPGFKPKFASAHDLRRSCADRLDGAGVDPRLIARVLRHKSYETTRRHYLKGDVQREAGRIREVLLAAGGSAPAPVTSAIPLQPANLLTVTSASATPPPATQTASRGSNANERTRTPGQVGGSSFRHRLWLEGHGIQEIGPGSSLVDDCAAPPAPPFTNDLRWTRMIPANGQTTTDALVGRSRQGHDAS